MGHAPTGATSNRAATNHKPHRAINGRAQKRRYIPDTISIAAEKSTRIGQMFRASARASRSVGREFSHLAPYGRPSLHSLHGPLVHEVAPRGYEVPTRAVLVRADSSSKNVRRYACWETRTSWQRL